MFYYHQGLFVPRAVESRASTGQAVGYSFGNDFYQVWLTSQETLRRPTNLYGDDITREIQIGIYGRALDVPSRAGDPIDRRIFPYPAFTDLLFLPAGKFPFPAVRIVVLCLLTLLTVASVWLWTEALGLSLDWRWLTFIVALVLTSYPVLEGLYAGQIGLIVAFLLAGGILALRREKFLLSGFLMALTTIKPQVTFLAVLYLLFWSLSRPRHRARFAISFMAMESLLVGASLLVWPNWIRSWAGVLPAYRAYNPPPLLIQVLPTLPEPDGSKLILYLLTASLWMGALVFAWRSREAEAKSDEFWLTLNVLLVLTPIFVLSGQAVYDHIIILPAILFLAFQWRTLSPGRVMKVLLGLGSAVLFWPWIASCALILARPFLTHRQFYSKGIFLLPICLAAAFPFVVLGPLILAVRDWKLSHGRNLNPMAGTS
jgi:hypothetical protein